MLQESLPGTVLIIINTIVTSDPYFERRAVARQKVVYQLKLLLSCPIGITGRYKTNGNDLQCDSLDETLPSTMPRRRRNSFHR